MTNAIPQAEEVFRLLVTCDMPTQLGRINGGNAMMIPITGGKVSGDRLSGEVMSGGADWAVRYEDGRVVVDARYAIKADDGTIIQIFNGASRRIAPGESPATMKIITSPRFVAPEGPHDWLNHSVFVGTLEPDTGGQFAVRIVIYKMV